MALWSSLDFDTDAVAVLSDDERYSAVLPSRMVPLTQQPLLLLQSSTPIISREGCSLLSRYFDGLARKNDEMMMAQSLLSEIHDVIDTLTNSPRHDGDMHVPRCVRYESNVVDETLLLENTERFGSVLLPDGLHVDTNNGKLFRHITAILYLTDNQDGYWATNEGNTFFAAGGGTTFPLATPYHGDNAEGSCDANLHEAARGLLECNVQHTKGDEDGTAASVLESAALDVFYRDIGKYHPGGPNNGLRVMPEQGKLIYFHNVDDAGFPDPLSFHGGEELVALLPPSNDSTQVAVANTKSILVFFKEIPIDAFRERGREGFAEEARRARCWTQTAYY